MTSSLLQLDVEEDLKEQEIDFEDQEQEGLSGSPMDSPIDHTDLVAGDLSAEPLGSDTPVSQIRYNMPTLQRSTKTNMFYEGFPVYTVPSEGARILDPPCVVCGNLDEKLFYSVGSAPFDAFYRVATDLHMGASSLGCLSCMLLLAILEPYEGRHSDRTLNTAGTACLIIARNTPRFSIPMSKIFGYDHTLEVCTTKKTPCLWPSIEPYPLIWNTTIASQRISEWLHECSWNHACYNTTSLPALPTRVLQILGPRRVRLHVSETGDRACYACLSHYWGGLVPLRLTCATFKAFQQNIPWNTLPCTFQDAIEMSLMLGVNFLWIDSLCIIQDDADDWRRESGLMASIYSKAYITLAASQASDSTQGLLVKPSLTKYKQFYTGYDSQGKMYEIFVKQSWKNFNKEYLPLLGRAWFFQEEILSPRTVHFTDSYMYLECSEYSDCADQDGIFPQANDIPKTIKSRLRENRSEPTIWHETVVHYSKLSMTYPKDVFPALQGVAKYIQDERQCAYFAGIWGDNVVIDLLWHTELYDSPDVIPDEIQYRAPTWSWASRPRCVEWYATSKNFKSDAVCISISTTPAGNDPLGEVIAGSLQLQGYCLPAVSEVEDEKPTLRIRLKDGTFVTTSWKPDTKFDNLSGGGLIVIRMGGSDIGGYCFFFYLVLVQISTDVEEYERVGIVTARDMLRMADEDTQNLLKHEGCKKIVTIM